MGSWILIWVVFVFTDPGAAVTSGTAYFNSKEACMAALSNIQGNTLHRNMGVDVFCTATGKKDGK